MIWREFDAAALNEIANHPEVRPGCGPGGELDFTDYLADERNVALNSGAGGCMFAWAGPGIYEVHTMFLPHARGAHARSTARDMLESMFDHHAARLLWCRIPLGNRPSRMFARMCGMVGAGVSHDPHLGPVELFTLENA